MKRENAFLFLASTGIRHELLSIIQREEYSGDSEEPVLETDQYGGELDFFEMACLTLIARRKKEIEELKGGIWFVMQRHVELATGLLWDSIYFRLNIPEDKGAIRKGFKVVIPALKTEPKSNKFPPAGASGT